MSDERDTLDGGAKRVGRTAADADERSASSVSRPSGKRSSRRTRDAGGVAVAPRSTKEADTQSVPATKADDRRPPRGPSKKTAKDKPAGRGNLFKRLRRFLREVVAELRKVIWPNRKQMVTYTSVVLVFMIFMVAFIGGLDVAFIKGVSWLFG